MVILNLKGGLGNQIFQFIAALRIASKNNEKLHIYTGNLKSFKTKRNFSLDVFIKYSPLEIVLLNKKKFFLNKYFLAVLKKLKIFILTEKNFFSKSFSALTIIDDYFIDSKFLDDVLLVCLKESLDKEYLHLLSKFQIKGGIGIHIRGTDRLLENLPVNYETILQNISVNCDETLYCFTDDFIFANDQLKNIKNKVVYISDYNLSDIEEFYLISQLDNFIVSNSTFSILARKMSSNETSTYVVKDFFATRDVALLEVFNFESTICYI